MPEPLTYERLAELLAYDPETGVLTRSGRPVGTRRSDGYLVIRIDRTLHYAHRLAWALHHGYLPEHEVDHKNRDRSDNRISNLRLASNFQNGCNSHRAKIASSGFRGVRAYDSSKPFRVHIRVNGSKLHLGSYGSAADAAMAYDRAAIYFHGDFAVTNFSLGLL